MALLGSSSDRDYFVVQVPMDKAAGFLPVVSELLKDAPMPGPVLYTVEDAFTMCALGRMQLWVMGSNSKKRIMAFMLTEIMTYPRGMTVNICLFAGENLRRVLQFQKYLENWAREIGATYIELVTHPKLARIIQKKGFHPTGIRMHKPIMRLN